MGQHPAFTKMRTSTSFALLLIAVCFGRATAQPAMRRYSSSYSSGTAEAKTITQAVTLSITSAQYSGNYKTLMETAYGIALSIYDTSASPPAFFTGCSVTSTAARRSAVVTFAATALTTTSMTTAISSAKTSLGSAYTSLTVTVSNVATPTVTNSGTTSGADKIGLGLVAMAVSLFALRH